jgi:hypothetical protein
MRSPIFALLSLAIPVTVGVAGYVLARNAKGATNMGEALGPLFTAAFALMAAAVLGELAAIVSFVRAERLAAVAWIGVAVNGILIAPLLYLLLTRD